MWPFHNLQPKLYYALAISIQTSDFHKKALGKNCLYLEKALKGKTTIE